MSVQKELDEINSIMHELEGKIQGTQLVKRKINTLSNDIEATDAQLKELVQQLQKERMDVDKLRKLSFTNFYHTVMNDKTEQLNKEETEVLEMKLKIDGFAAQRNAQNETLQKLKSNYSEANGLEEKWQRLFDKKKKLLEANFPKVRSEVEEQEKSISMEEMNLKEIAEAIFAGKDAMNQVEKIQASLTSAANWGTYDLLGGGILATMAKRGHLDTAQEEMHTFQSHLKAFNRELRDVGETVSFELQIDEFLNFADWFFDGFFVDWAVQSKIEKAQGQMAELQAKIKDIMTKLEIESDTGKKRIAALKQKIDQLIQEV